MTAPTRQDRSYISVAHCRRLMKCSESKIHAMVVRKELQSDMVAGRAVIVVASLPLDIYAKLEHEWKQEDAKR